MKTKREAGLTRAGGHTLPELVTVLAVLGIVASLALPSFGAMVLDTRRAGAVNDLLLTFRLARSEADTRQRSVIVCAVSDRDRNGVLDPAEHACAGRDWSFGWMLAQWHDADADGGAAADELVVLRVFQTGARGQLAVTAGHFSGSADPSGTMLFRPSGRRASNGSVVFCDKRGPSSARAVIFSSAGRARVSSRAAGGGPLACPSLPRP